MSYSLYNEDCMKIFPTIEDKSIQCTIPFYAYEIPI